NDMLAGVHYDIHNALTDQAAAERVRLAFGNNWQTHHEQLREDVNALRDAKITIKHSNPQKAEDHQYAERLRREGREASGTVKQEFLAHTDRTGVNDESKPAIMWLGSGWHDDKEYGRANRAGTALHEAVHAVLRGGDHMYNDGTTSKYINSEEAGRLRQTLPPDQYNSQVTKEVGYFGSGNVPNSAGGTNYKEVLGAHDVMRHGAGIVSAEWTDRMNNAANPHRNPDAWKLLGSLQETEVRKWAEDEETRRDAQNKAYFEAAVQIPKLEKQKAMNGGELSPNSEQQLQDHKDACENVGNLRKRGCVPKGKAKQAANANRLKEMEQKLIDGKELSHSEKAEWKSRTDKCDGGGLRKRGECPFRQRQEAREQAQREAAGFKGIEKGNKSASKTKPQSKPKTPGKKALGAKVKGKPTSKQPSVIKSKSKAGPRTKAVGKGKKPKATGRNKLASKGRSKAASKASRGKAAKSKALGKTTSKSRAGRKIKKSKSGGKGKSAMKSKGKAALRSKTDKGKSASRVKGVRKGKATKVSAKNKLLSKAKGKSASKSKVSRSKTAIKSKSTSKAKAVRKGKTAKASARNKLALKSKGKATLRSKAMGKSKTGFKAKSIGKGKAKKTAGKNK
ncbi:11087_t:CDS:2, partial [Acaulospora colombiana]